MRFFFNVVTPRDAMSERPSPPRDGDRLRGTIEGVVRFGRQQGAGWIATPFGLTFFPAREWRGAEPPTRGQRVIYIFRGWNRATRIEPEPEPSP